VTLVGQFVKAFAEASHVLPVGMHLNAEYPLIVPAIVALSAGEGVAVQEDRPRAFRAGLERLKACAHHEGRPLGRAFVCLAWMQKRAVEEWFVRRRIVL